MLRPEFMRGLPGPHFGIGVPRSGRCEGGTPRAARRVLASASEPLAARAVLPGAHPRHPRHPRL